MILWFIKTTSCFQRPLVVCKKRKKTMCPSNRQMIAIWVSVAAIGSYLAVVMDTIDAPASSSDVDVTNEENYETLRLNDQPLTEHRQLPSDCKSPCNCTIEPSCKAGVSIIQDGCSCCLMCARQQGDLCNTKDKCDEKKGLYCDLRLDAGLRGTCRAKVPKNCVVEGKVYQDGQTFHPNCSLLCTCQDGKYACSSKCPQELRLPSSVHCRGPQLVAIKDRCCKEWVCPHQHSMIDRDNNTASDRCKKESTAWSGCSVTCGTGESIRVTSDNKDCKSIQERRLCMVRPCPLATDQMATKSGKKCRSTYEDQPKKIEFENCGSEKDYKMKYCTTCKRNKCCGPDKTKTKPISFQCPDNKIISKAVMFITSCKCYRLKDCPFM